MCFSPFTGMDLMSRVSVVLNVLLAFVVAALAWALYARTDDGGAPGKRMSAAESGRSDVPISGLDADVADRLAVQLARIDARLAVLESGASRGGAIAPAVQSAAPEMSVVEADRRLGLLLPVREIRTADLPRFHAKLASLPPEDQFAIASALSRAINDRRVRVHP